MGKINKENLISLIKVGIIGLGLLFGIFILFFAVPLSLVKNEKILDIYIPSVILVILVLPVLVILYYSCIAYKNNKPKYIDGKYMWKDGRVYEGDWDKRYGANGKGKLTWADGSYYEGEFKKGHLSGKGKKVCPNGGNYEGDWENSKGNGKGKLTWADGSYYVGEFKDGKMDGKGKLIWSDGSYYEGDFKDGKMDGEGIIEMNSGFSYIGEFSEGRAKGKMRKQKHSDGSVIEGSFVCDGFKDFTGEGKTTYSKGFVYIGKYKDGVPAGKGKRMLNNGEYSEGNRVNGVLTGLARYYFKDGSYYEGECGDMGWQGIGTYVTKNGEEYQTEFPYGILDVFRYGFNSKIEEIHGSLNYVPKSEKEKAEVKDKYLEISGKGTPIQKEIAKFFLEEEEDNENFLNSLKSDSSVGNVLKFFKNILKFYEESKKNIKKIADKNHIEYSGKVSSYSYGSFFYKLDCCYDVAIEISELFIIIYKFLSPENILKFITKREEMNKERVILFNEFSSKYKEYIQTCLDWREYEKKFWKHNFKPDKKSK